MHRAIALLLMLVCALSQPVDETKNTVPGVDPKVAGGKDATDGQFPSQVFIYKADTKDFLCSGILVAADKVLTTTKCSMVTALNNVKVGAGNIVKTENTPSLLKTVTSIANHDNLAQCPVSILNLESKFDTSGKSIKVIPLANADVSSDATCTISGWGDGTLAGTYADTLNYADVNIVNRDECVKQYTGPGSNVVTDGVICTGNAKGGNSCLSDEGGPLICNNVLNGVIFGGTCGLGGLPSLNVDVNYCRGWINSQINSAGILSKQSLLIYALFIMLTRWISRS